MEENIPQDQKVKTPVAHAKSWLKVIQFSTVGLILAGGLIFAGIQMSKISKLKSQISKPQLKSQNLTPTQILIPTQNLPPATDSTTNWKTYTNTKYRYELKYPSSWEVYIPRGLINKNPGELVEVALYDPLCKGSTIFTIIVSTDSYQSIISKLESEWWGGIEQSPNIAEEIELAGARGKKIKGTNIPTGASIIRVILSKNNLTYDFISSLGFEEKSCGYITDIFDQILSTFKFL